jgi:hypothetical protein
MAVAASHSSWCDLGGLHKSHGLNAEHHIFTGKMVINPHFETNILIYTTQLQVLDDIRASFFLPSLSTIRKSHNMTAAAHRDVAIRR